MPAHELLRDRAVDVLSIDAFDTLLLRAVARPADAFTVLGHRLVAAGLLSPFVTPSLFASARVRAELRARTTRRRHGEFPEVTLGEIYAEIPDVMLATTRSSLVDAELALEGELVFSDPAVAALARAARAQGVRIAIVSETYLSGGQLSVLLGRASLDDLHAAVFTSSDHRAGKATGLFHVVLRELGVDAERVVHVGDHVEADIDAARAEGLRAVLLELRTEAFEEVIRREREVVAASPTDARLIDPDAGDLGVTAVRARAAAAGAPADVPEHAHAHWVAGASVFGPVFTGFADWVVDRASARGVRRVACLMREGTLLAPLVRAAAAAQGVTLDADPLWLSRQVCARAAIERGDYAELRVFVERRVPPTLAELCAVLGVAPTELGALSAHLDTRLDDLALREAALGKIMGDDEVHARLLAGAAELRERLVRLVDAARHPSDDALTLVDLGWHATTQRLLVRALELAGHDLPVAGLYLLTTDALVDAALSGVDAEGYLAQAGEPAATTLAIVRSPEMLEQLCMGPDGSMLDLDASGHPVLGRVGVPERQLEEAQATRDGIFEFGERFRSMRPGISLAGAAALLRPTLARFVVEPTKAEVMVFGAWFHDDNFGTATGAMLARSYLLHDGSYADPATEGEIDAYWPAAVVARDGGPSRVSGRALGDSPVATIALYADTGTGFDEVHAVHRTIPVNERGLSYVQLGVAADGIRTLRLDPVSRYALVRIDRITLKLSVRDRHDAVIRSFTTPEELAAWELRDCTWLAGGLLVARSADPQMLLDLSQRVPGDVYAVLASVAFAVVELPEAAIDEGGEVRLAADEVQAKGTRTLRELRSLAAEVRAATARHLASGRRARDADG